MQYEASLIRACVLSKVSRKQPTPVAELAVHHLLSSAGLVPWKTLVRSCRLRCDGPLSVVEKTASLRSVYGASPRVT
jgi:predicted metal-binding membrane protein